MQKLFGGILMAVGVLIGGLSGLCTLALLLSALVDPGMLLSGGLAAVGSSLMVVLIVGGIPILAGVGSFIAGRRLVRRAQAEEAAATVTPAAEPPVGDAQE